MGMKFRVAVAAAAFALSAPALAVPSIDFDENSNTVSGQIFADFESGSAAGPGVTSNNVVVLSGDTGGVGVGPKPQDGKFLSILGGGNYTIQAPSATYLVSFLVGTLDTYNTVTLVTNVGSYILSGRQIFGQTPIPGEPSNLPSPNNGAVTYTFGSGEFLQSISFSSSQTAFEIDSIAFATPEPGTWAMLILGFGLAGYGIRRRKRSTGLAFA